MHLASALLLLFALSHHSHAWGGVGHQLTGALAQRFTSDATNTLLQSTLSPDMNGSLKSSATWADSIKHHKGWTWSAKLHYIDANDNPSADCGVDMERDCPDGKCIVGAVANYTARLECSYSAAERTEAAQFLSHFVGDLTQPLHNCKRLVGGNDVYIKFDGKVKGPWGKLNLHEIWDINIIEKRLKTDFGGKFDTYADYLYGLATNDFKDQVNTWTGCITEARALRHRTTPNNADVTQCALSWAVDSDELNCDVVWKPWEDQPKQDFGKKYYQDVYPVIEKQLVKAGVRMAALFDARLEQCNDMRRPKGSKNRA